MYNRIALIEKVEQFAAEAQKKLTALGYKPVMYLVDVDELASGNWGEYYPDTETLVIDALHAHLNSDEDVSDTVHHEMVHLYMAKYHPEVTEIHGPEFWALMAKLGFPKGV